MNDNAENRAFVFLAADNVIDIGAEANRHAELFHHLEFLQHNTGAGTVLRRHIARNAVAAFLTDGVREEFHAQFIHAPLIVRERVAGNFMNLLRIVHVVAGLQNVVFQQFNGVLNVVHLLLRAARSRQNAAIDDRVSAGSRHLLEHDDV